MDGKKKALLFLLAIVIATGALFSSQASAQQTETTPTEIEPNVFFYKEKTFDLIENRNTNISTYKTTPGLERITNSFDVNGRPVYSDYKYSEDDGAITVETAHGSVILHKNFCSFSFYRGGLIDADIAPLFSDSIVAKHATVDTSNWQKINQINNAACIASVEANATGVVLSALKSKDGIGFVDYQYVFKKNIWKTNLIAYNNNTVTNQKFGFTQTIDLNKASIKFGNETRNLTFFNGTTFDRAWLVAHKANVIDFMNGQAFDFDVSFDYLESATVWAFADGTSKLAFNYFNTNEPLLPGERITLDPTYSNTESSDGKVAGNGLADTICSPTFNSGSAISRILMRSSADAGVASCEGAYTIFDVSTIPTDSYFVSGSLAWTIGTSTITQTCGVRYLDFTPAANQNTYDNIVLSTGTSFTNFETGATWCQSAGAKTITFDASDLSTLSDELQSGDAEFAFGFRAEGARTGATLLTNDDSFDAMTLTLDYLSVTNPDAVTDLASDFTGDVYVDLTWSTPGDGGGIITGYQINDTTPHAEPLTIIESDTGNTDTTATVTGLTPLTPYSFRVSALNQLGGNDTGNILNITTIAFVPANFTIGSINVNVTNPDMVGIRFERDDLNTTATFVNVTYADTYDLACDLQYVYAQTNRTYTNMANVTIDDDFVESSFLFLDHGNEVINIICWDQNTNDTGRYVLTQDDFLLLQQIRDFRAGEFGTMGLFGVIDMVTLAVVILSMIGFNRLSESVGAIFTSIMLGVLGWFEIISFPAIFFGALAVVIMLAIFSTRKD